VRAFLLLIPLLVSGCNVFDFLSPTAVEGIFVGVEVANGETTLGDGPVLGAAFLANATSIHDFASNLVTDPDRIVLRTQGNQAPLEDQGDGLFATGEQALTELVWSAGSTVEVEMVLDGETNTGFVTIPDGPSLSGVPQALHLDQIPTDWENLTKQEVLQLIDEQADAAEFHPSGQSLKVDLTGSDFEYWVVFVSDQEGNVTYNNLPQEANELVDWVVESEPIDTFEIPGSAFPEPNTMYAVGVAGVVFADTKDYAGFNWLISNLGAGTLTVSALVTEP
jgi:hypothetical protein